MIQYGLNLGYLDTVKIRDSPLFADSETTVKTFPTLYEQSRNKEL